MMLGQDIQNNATRNIHLFTKTRKFYLINHSLTYWSLGKYTYIIISLPFQWSLQHWDIASTWNLSSFKTGIHSSYIANILLIACGHKEPGHQQPWYWLFSSRICWFQHQDGYSSRADSRYAPSRWEAALLCSDVSHWLGTSQESALLQYYYKHMLSYQCSNALTIIIITGWGNGLAPPLIGKYIKSYNPGAHMAFNRLSIFPQHN